MFRGEFEYSDLLVISKDNEMIAELATTLPNLGCAVDVVFNERGVAERDWSPSSQIALLDEGVDFPLPKDLVKNRQTIVVSDNNDPDHIAEVLDSGVEQYLVKPINPRMVSSVATALERNQRVFKGARRKYSSPDLDVDFDGREVTLNGRTLSLKPFEYELLELMLNGSVLDAESYVEYFQANDKDVSPRAFKVHINNLRRTMDRPGYQSHFRNIRNVGYQYVANPKQLPEAS